MANFCECSKSSSSKNTGTTRKQREIRTSALSFIVPLFAADGTRNEISANDVLDKAYFDARISDPDPTKRWYPIADQTNVIDARADSSFETFIDNSRKKTSQGLRTTTKWLLGYSPAFIGKLENIFCEKVGVFDVDRCGDLTGTFCAGAGTSGEDVLRPTQINEQSADFILVKGADDVSGKVQITYDVAQIEKDSALRKILAGEVTGVSLLDYRGLLDMTGVYTAVTPSGFTLALTADYDQIFEAEKISGLVLADFSVFNNTTNAAVVVTSVTESSKGVYDVVIPAQTAADEVLVNVINSSFYHESTQTL